MSKVEEEPKNFWIHNTFKTSQKNWSEAIQMLHIVSALYGMQLLVGDFFASCPNKHRTPEMMWYSGKICSSWSGLKSCPWDSLSCYHGQVMVPVKSTTSHQKTQLVPAKSLAVMTFNKAPQPLCTSVFPVKWGDWTKWCLMSLPALDPKKYITLAVIFHCRKLK